MDLKRSSAKFAIVAPGGIAWVLGRMYQSYRELDQSSTKAVAVFRTRAEAVAWLGVAIESSA